ncbi:MAG: globin domain-containing protein [Myxococcota bacterium]
MEQGFDASALVDALGLIAENEARFTERFYELFFELRPDTRPLFGRYSISEQEEMMRETLRSLHALSEGEDWLNENLAALGASHEEYGVTTDMYPSYVEAMIACAEEVLGEAFGEDAMRAIRTALDDVTSTMAQAGSDSAGTAKS